MRFIMISQLILLMYVLGSAQKLPEGTIHTAREREIDIRHLRLELGIDMKKETIKGEVRLSFTPLHPLSDFSLDAINLEIQKVYLLTEDGRVDLGFKTENTRLHIYLDHDYTHHDSLHIAVTYQAAPKDGMYFAEDPAKPDEKYCFTYGEGGLHANWIPIYNGNDDKFSSEMLISVDQPYRVISNGKLVGDTPAGQYHWIQEKPHSNYLMVIYAGNFDSGKITGPDQDPPETYWVPKNSSRLADYTFRDTPEMIKFFSAFTGTGYPWVKYDQVVIPGYAIGGMEHTSATGLRYATLRDSTAPESSSPDFDDYHQIWTSESLVSHELAHMWFGDLVTCRDLRYIWLNESFATFMQFQWDKKNFGKTYFDIDRITALDQYLEYVKLSHIIRPLEFNRFDTPSGMYNEPHTYFKGALVLHMLNKILGDEDFRRVLQVYLNRFEFRNVVSTDFQKIIWEQTGRDPDWFFNDWIFGGGHPVFETSYEYLPDVNNVLLRVSQVQPIIDGQDLFRLPVTITIETGNVRSEREITVSKDYEEFLLPCPDYPLMVSVDGNGDLVADIREDKPFQDWVYQARNDALAGRIRALRHLVKNHPNDPQTRDLIQSSLTDENAWPVRAESALLSGLLEFSVNEKILNAASHDRDYRVRKALLIGLRHGPAKAAAQFIQNMLPLENHTDVQGTALVTLSLLNPAVCRALVPEYLKKESWYDEIRIACMKSAENIADPAMLDMIKPYTSRRYNYQLRRAAFLAWKAISPDDRELEKLLVREATQGSYSTRAFSIDLLGDIYAVSALEQLRSISDTTGDPDVKAAADGAIKKIMTARND
jgi:aminopeptidase N